MPRLDNSDSHNIFHFQLDYDEGDPGATPPIDLCHRCYESAYYDEEQIEHPPYEEQWPRYTCMDCEQSLHEPDN